ncbi:Rid family hydrolase [Candidatus Latescibacterota bacterium]
MELKFFTSGNFVKGSSATTSGGAGEFFLTISSDEKESFSGELDSLHDSYMSALKEYGLSDDTLVFSRFFMSDIANRKNILEESKIYKTARNGAVSVIQQPPVDGGSVSLLTYHIKSGDGALKKTLLSYDEENWRHGLLVEGSNYNFLWTTNFHDTEAFDSYKQTSGIFKSYNKIIDEYGMNLLDNVVRTWFFVRDVDNHYLGLVESRKEFFAEHGLTPETRYIASTGIEGISKEVDSLVDFDALAVSNLKSGQNVRMDALENLSPTIKYGGTFERGTRIRFGDRSHLYISGTASIDKDGEVIHLSDVGKQTQRTLDNIKALLEPHGAGLNDMAYLIVYIRTFKYREKVAEVLDKELSRDIPLIFVESPVCRPTWLVEMEGIGIIPDSNDFPLFF